MAAPENVIHVPRPDRSSFSKNRSLSRNLLLQAQVRHFQEAEGHLPSERRSGMNVDDITTEGEAAEYLRRVTFALHPEGARKGKVRRAT